MTTNITSWAVRWPKSWPARAIAVTLVTPYPQVSGWTVYTDEQGFHARPADGAGRHMLVTQHQITEQAAGPYARIACTTTGQTRDTSLPDAWSL
jgi:hypothetical protein